MTNANNQRYEVQPCGNQYQVVLKVNVLYRDGSGTIRRQMVTQSRYGIYCTPLEAQEVADRWNAEDEQAQDGEE